MAQTYLLYYSLISAVLSLVDLHFAIKAFRKPEKVGRALGWVNTQVLTGAGALAAAALRAMGLMG